MYMFGKINNKQDIVDISSAKLFSNSIFIGVQSNIDEEELYKIIKIYYNKNDKKKLLYYYNIYIEYKYKKYLDILNNYINNMQ